VPGYTEHFITVVQNEIVGESSATNLK